MPADTKAIKYHWFMTGVPDHLRVIGFEWIPENGEIISSMTFGELHFITRDTPDDEWVQREEHTDVPWAVAQNLARHEGFTVEVPIYA